MEGSEKISAVIRVLVGDDNCVDQVGVDREVDEGARSGITPHPGAGLFHQIPGGRSTGNGKGAR
jgi:hypothetical protein